MRKLNWYVDQNDKINCPSTYGKDVLKSDLNIL